MRVALVSLDQAWVNKDLNIQACRLYIQKAKEQSFSATQDRKPELYKIIL